jgi:hypothetical protein
MSDVSCVLYPDEYRKHSPIDHPPYPFNYFLEN